MKHNLYRFVFCLLAFYSQAQEGKEPSQAASMSGTLGDQFDYVYGKSSNFEDYKVVKKEHFNYLKSNSLDSIDRFKREGLEAKQRVTTYKQEIAKLATSLANSQEELAKLQTEQNSIGFFGVALSKTSYKFIMWSVVVILILLLLLFFYKMQRAIIVAKEASGIVEKIETEFEDYKHKALEKEQKMGRQLLDEINKNRKAK